MGAITTMRHNLPSDAAARKAAPVASGVLDYFPLAIAEIARVSKAGNDQHNPGQPLHWARGKSVDHADCIARHLMDRGTIDTDGMRHSAKVAWRALALLQTELEIAAGIDPFETRPGPDAAVHAARVSNIKSNFWPPGIAYAGASGVPGDDNEIDFK